jgi:hypothetical protein
VLNTSLAYEFNDATNVAQYLDKGTKQNTCDTDPNGQRMIDAVMLNGKAYEWRPTTGLSYLGANADSTSKSSAGLVDLVCSDATAFGSDASGWFFLEGRPELAK